MQPSTINEGVLYLELLKKPGQNKWQFEFKYMGVAILQQHKQVIEKHMKNLENPSKNIIENSKEHQKYDRDKAQNHYKTTRKQSNTHQKPSQKPLKDPFFSAS